MIVCVVVVVLSGRAEDSVSLAVCDCVCCCCCQEELKILRLRYALLVEEELDTREKELNFKLAHKKKLKVVQCRPCSNTAFIAQPFTMPQ
jgi:hypothetical protein